MGQLRNVVANYQELQSYFLNIGSSESGNKEGV